MAHNLQLCAKHNAEKQLVRTRQLAKVTSGLVVLRGVNFVSLHGGSVIGHI